MLLTTGLPTPTKPLLPASLATFGRDVGRRAVVARAKSLPLKSVSAQRDQRSTKAETPAPNPAAGAEHDLSRLMHDIQSGIQSAFDKLYALTKAKLLRCILRIERDRIEAEDILQDVYLRVWSLSGQFDASKGSVDMWLTGIAKNMALDRARRRNARPKALEHGADADPYELLASTENGPLERTMQAQDAAAVQRCLGALRPTQREVLLLAFWSSLTYAEIADLSGRPLGTIKSWASRSLREMRKGLVQAQVSVA